LQFKGRYGGGREPDDLITYAFWLGQNHFVLPLSKDMRKFFICNVQAAIADSLNGPPAAVKPREKQKKR
jgi:hypothetical protein